MSNIRNSCLSSVLWLVFGLSNNVSLHCIMLLFLDIDGVMVPAKSWKPLELLADGFPAFSPQAIAVLQQLITEDVTIMLTTSHKASYTLNKWKTIFKNRGIEIMNIAALPENTEGLNRKAEILNWFNLNPIHEDFIIIDDDKSLNDLPAFLKEKLIQTSSYIGLRAEHWEMIKALKANSIPELV